MDKLIKVLETSVEMHGQNHPLTLGHLLNIAKMIKRIEDQEEEERYQNEQEALNSLNDNYGS